MLLTIPFITKRPAEGWQVLPHTLTAIIHGELLPRFGEHWREPCHAQDYIGDYLHSAWDFLQKHKYDFPQLLEVFLTIFRVDVWVWDREGG